MKFSKPAVTVDQQVELLQRRGMEVTDTEAAKQFLHHVSYYRLRAYWLPDEAPAPAQGDHAFTPGTRFDTIVDLYSFDRKLRLLVMDAIERVEVSMRTRWAHVLSLRYGSHGYLDAKPKRIYNTLIMLAYMLDIISPNSQWRARMHELLDEHPQVDQESMGFPVNWRHSRIWVMT